MEDAQVARDVAESLTAVYNSFSGFGEVETAREMRFGLHLIVNRFRELIDDGQRDRDVFRSNAVFAVDELDTSVENVRLLAAKAIGEVLATAPWSLDAIDIEGRRLAAEEQLTNITLRQILSGIRVVNELLSAVLIADGSEDLEFDEPSESGDEENSEEDTGDGPTAAGSYGTTTTIVTASLPTRPSSSVQQTATFQRLQRRRGERITWTAEEVGILVQVARDPQFHGRGAHVIGTEHNRRMLRNRQSVGAVVHADRRIDAVAFRLKVLRKTHAGI